MKKLIFIALLGLIACKKEEIATIVNPTNSSPTIIHDSKLKGKWLCDSSQSEGGIMAYSTTQYESTKNIADYVIDENKSNGILIYKSKNQLWKTEKDSLFCGSDSLYLLNHYQYTFIGSVLRLRLDSKSISNAKYVDYYYHKI